MPRKATLPTLCSCFSVTCVDRKKIAARGLVTPAQIDISGMASKPRKTFGGVTSGTEKTHICKTHVKNGDKRRRIWGEDPRISAESGISSKLA